MNLYFRLLIRLWMTWIKPRPLGLLDTSELPGRVWPMDLDTNLHMNNGRYLSLMDLGGSTWWPGRDFLAPSCETTGIPFWVPPGSTISTP